MTTVRCILWLCVMMSVFIIGGLLRSERLTLWLIHHIDPEELEETKSWTRY